jgi:hypothetical protein
LTDAFLKLAGYDLQPELRKDRIDMTNGGGGGLLFYIREGLTV